MLGNRAALLSLIAVGAAVAGFAPVRDDSPLPFYYDLYTFRGNGGNTAVVAAFAVPAGLLQAEHNGRGVRYRFDVTLVLADTALYSVSRTDDSVFVDFNRNLGSDHLLYTQIQVETPPSRSTLQRVIMTDATTPGIGQLYGSYFPIRDYRGSQLMLSDIALGLPETSGGWKRRDVQLALLPTSRFPASAFDVYYEIYNLPHDHRYLTEISVANAEGDPERDGGPVRLRFTGRSNAGADSCQAELRRVETSLARGRHRITVTITDQETGASASRSREFEVRGPGPGATMVPAMPRRTLWPPRKQ